MVYQARHTQSQKTVDARKEEMFHGKLFLATLWAKLLLITVNFGNKTKVFSENFGWVLKHLVLDVHNSLKAENKPKKLAGGLSQSIIQ